MALMWRAEQVNSSLGVPAESALPVIEWRRYSALFTIFATVLIYSGFAFQSRTLGLSPLPYQVWFGLLLFGSFPVLAKVAREGLQFPAIMIWAYAYLLVAIGWTFISLDVATSIYAVGVVIVFFITMLVFYLTFGQRDMRVLAIKAIFWVTLFGSILNIVQNRMGMWRPGGLHIDPNTSSCALVMGMVVTNQYVRPKYRIVYQVFVFLGIVMTLSRGGLVEWGAAIILLYVFGRERAAQSKSMLFIAICLVGLTISPIGQGLVDGFIESTPQASRLFGLGDSEELEEDSRFVLVQEAWTRIERHPFVGSGTGMAEIYEDGAWYGPHNMYLLFMMQFGMWSALIYVALAFVLARLDRRRWFFSIPLAVTFLLVGMFDHNVLVQWHYALMFALVVRMDGTEFSSQHTPMSLTDTNRATSAVDHRMLPA